MEQNSLSDTLSHRDKRQKIYHHSEEIEELLNVVPPLTDEQWFKVLGMIWSGSNPLIASSLNYCIQLKGLTWMLHQAKAAIRLQTAYAVFNGLVLKSRLSQAAVQLYNYIQEHFGLIPQPTNEVIHLRNPFVY